MTGDRYEMTRLTAKVVGVLVLVVAVISLVSHHAEPIVGGTLGGIYLLGLNAALERWFL